MDWTPVIVSLTVFAGTIATVLVNKYGKRKDAELQAQANALAQREREFDEQDQLLVRSREETDRARADADRERTRRIDADNAHFEAMQGKNAQIRELTEALTLLQRAIHDEVMKAAAQTVIEHTKPAD